MVRTIAALTLFLLVPSLGLATGRTYYLHQSATPVAVPGGTTTTYLDGNPVAGGPIKANKIHIGSNSTGSYVHVGTPFASAVTLDTFVTATVHLSANQPMNGCAQIGFSLARVSASGAMTVLGTGSTPSGQSIPQTNGGGTGGFAPFSALFQLSAADRSIPAGASIAIIVSVYNGCSNRGVTLTSDGGAPSRLDFEGAGVATLPTGITTQGATLQALQDPMGLYTAHFQYWQDGATGPSTTASQIAGGVPNGSFSATVSGLSPSTLYHYQICGYETYNNAGYPPYDNFPGICTGALAGGVVTGWNDAGTLPTTGDLNATVNFRTAGPGTKATIDLGAVTSTADTAAAPILRDGGLSVQYSTNPPLSLWIFGDTQRNYVGFIPYGTAIAGPFTPGQAPTGLNELPRPPNPPSAGLPFPSAFFPTPAPLKKTNGSACTGFGAYAADWLRGATAIPNSSLLLLLYGEFCIEADTDPVTPGDQLAFTLERIAFARYNPATNAFVQVDHPFVASPLSAGIVGPKALGSPVFGGDGYLYLFAAECEGFFCATKGAVEVARVSADPAAWSSSANFTWWDGSTWTTNSAAAANVIPGIVPLGGGVDVADYSATSPKKYVLTQQAGFANGAFQAWEATSLVGPWTAGTAGIVPDACTGGLFGCYALTGHPELSTPTQFVFSWFSVDDRNNYGRIRVGAIDW